MSLPLTRLRDLSFKTSIYGIEERIVLDIGSCYIKCGFSGESRPRQFISMFLSEEALDDYLGLRPVHRQHFGHECSEICNERANQACRGDHPLEYAELYELDFLTKDNKALSEEKRLKILEERLSEYLHDVYFKHLLTDPKQRKVIICESPLAPLGLKQTIAKVLFEKLQAPSVSFTNSHLLALLTTGTTTGLVIDCGHLETSVLPIYASRPLTPLIQTTPRAGKFLSQHLKQLLRDKCPVSVADNPTELRVTPDRLLTSAFLETIKTRLLFASPLLVNARDNIREEEMNDSYRDMSTASEVHVEVWLEEQQARGIMAIPGWVRERASECLFQGDVDALSLTDVILEAVSKAPSDLRRPLISSMLLVGGTAQLPNLQNRLLQEIKRAIQTVPKWEKLKGLMDSVRFLDDLTDEDKASLSTAVGFVGGGTGPSRSSSAMDLDPTGELVSASGSSGNLAGRDTKEKKSSKEKKAYQSSGKVFMPNCRSWIGGSLVGSLKVSGPEILRENFNGTVPDWSTESLSVTTAATMASSTPSSAAPGFTHDGAPALGLSY
ncbi:actin-domain-containing protein [Mortierella sp. GBAus27b]|nr:hypothetical protein BGX31_001193 [Mortierella sp. GBA43]KAI8357398.1 actin-domain-containing protein [Mortierella sp. GBAus27b]